MTVKKPESDSGEYPIEKERRKSPTSVSKLDEEKKRIDELEKITNHREPVGENTMGSKVDSFRGDYQNKLLAPKMWLEAGKTPDYLRGKNLYPIKTFRETFPAETPKEKDLFDIERTDKLLNQINQGNLDNATMIQKLQEIIDILKGKI